MDRMLETLHSSFNLRELDADAFASLKVNGMKFSIRAFEAKGFGHISIMQAKGFFGLMRMDTLILNPTEVDAPLLSYDRVLAMGNDTLIFELYDTQLAPFDLAKTQAAKDACAALPDHDLGTHWYDDIKLPQSFAKKGKKAQTAAFTKAAQDYLATYLADAATAPACDPDKKQEKASVYVEGLLAHGGPSTDVFKKALGDEQTAKLFRTILFGTKA